MFKKTFELDGAAFFFPCTFLSQLKPCICQRKMFQRDKIRYFSLASFSHFYASLICAEKQPSAVYRGRFIFFYCLFFHTVLHMFEKTFQRDIVCYFSLAYFSFQKNCFPFEEKKPLCDQSRIFVSLKNIGSLQKAGRPTRGSSCKPIST